MNKEKRKGIRKPFYIVAFTAFRFSWFICGTFLSTMFNKIDKQAQGMIAIMFFVAGAAGIVAMMPWITVVFIFVIALILTNEPYTTEEKLNADMDRYFKELE